MSIKGRAATLTSVGLLLCGCLPNATSLNFTAPNGNSHSSDTAPSAPSSGDSGPTTSPATNNSGNSGNSSTGNVLSVCQSGCTYSLPSQALDAASPGDTIQISPGTYIDCMSINKDNITVTGVGGMPAMTGKVCAQKGIIVTAAKNAVIKNLELYGATNNVNLAGIRHDAAGLNLTLDNVYIHDNDDGILGGKLGDTILIQNSRFEKNGMNDSSGYAHNLYIGEATSFTFKNSQSLRAKLGGHEIKTRAYKTVIDSSVVATLDGDDSRALDACEGGELIIRNSVFQKSPSSENSAFIAFAAESFDSRLHSVTMDTNNIFLDDRGGGTGVQFFHVPATISITGNTFVDIGGIASAGTPVSNQTYSSRSAAGYQAYPWLPTPN